MKSIVSRFIDAADAAPGKAALVVGGRRHGYAELRENVRRLAAHLAGMGVGPDARIGVVLPNGPEICEVLLAVADRNAAVAPVSTSLRGEALVLAMRRADITHAVGLADACAHLVDAGIVAADKVLAAGDAFAAVLAANPAYRLGALEQDLEAPYIITMTSGSTGAPKPIVFSQRTKIERARSAIDCYRLTAADVVLASTPIYHSLAQRLFLLPIMTGATSVVLEKFDPAGWIGAVQNEKVTFTIPVSSQLNAVLPEMLAGTADLSSLNTIVASSAPISLELKQELSARLSCDFHEIYGASELGVVSNLAPEDAAQKLATVGKPLDGIDVRILDDKGEPLPVGQIGEIAAKSPTAFAGYYRQPEMTAAAYAGDYFKTGDLGFMDADGYLSYSGRKKELIITGGINVYPQDVEAALNASGMVKECAVIGVDDAYFGEAVLACVVPADPAAFSKIALRKHCAEVLADYQQPIGYEVLDALPRNEMGKIMKPALNEKYKDIDLTASLRALMARRK